MKKSAETKRMFLFVCIVFYPVFLLISAPFVDSLSLRFILSAVASPIASSAAQKVHIYILDKRFTAQYHLFLQTLASDIFAGNALAGALLRAADGAPGYFGAKSRLTQILKESARKIKTQYPLPEVLHELSEQFPNTEAKALFLTLSESDLLGDRAVHIIAAAKERSSALQELEETGRSEQHGQIIQGVILTAMPFVLAFIFQGLFRSFSGSKQPLIAELLLIVSFYLAVSAILVTANILFPNPSKQQSKNTRVLNMPNRLAQAGPIKIISRILVAKLPAFYRSRIQSQLQEVQRIDETQYMGRKLSLTLISLLICLLLCTAGILPWYSMPIVTFGIWFAVDLDLRETIEQKRRQIIIELPLFLDNLLLQLKAGVVVPQGLANTLPILNTNSNGLHTIISRIIEGLALGKSLRSTLNEAADRCGVVTAQSVFFLLERFAQTGHRDLLNSLQRQKDLSWNQFRDQKNRKIREISAKLIFPMLLDLAAVMLLTLTPALSVFSGL